MTSTVKIQIGVVLAIVLVMGFLLSRPIKGLLAQENVAESTNETGSQFNLETISSLSKQGVNPAIVTEITELEKKQATANGNERIAILQELAGKWDDVAKYAPQGFIYEEMAEIAPQFEYYLKAGNAYRQAYTNLQDTVLARELNKRAIATYQKATELDESNLDAKTGLGAAMVTNGNNPMAGIAILREVVTKDPKNLEANKTLGLFSMQSRQFDRAIDRFLTVIEIKPDAESYFYLATSYENIGLKNEAISAFQKSKEMAADPSLSQFIDRRIEELSK